MQLAGQVAFVTGGASGIGLGIAASLTARGCAVALTDAREDALTSAAATLTANGGRVIACALDVTDRPAFRAAVTTAEQQLGPISLLVNNAGVGYSGIPLHETPDADVDWLIGVNVIGVMNGIKAVVPGMVTRRRGYILNVSSMSGLALPAGIHHGLYGATKAAVVFLSEGLRQDLAPYGIGVSVLCPGYVRTELPWSGNYRGAAFGGPRTSTPSKQILESLERALDPREVGEIAADAIAEDVFIVLTDLAEGGDVGEWHSRIAAAIRGFSNL